MTANFSPSSTFLMLPPEIRNNIYSFIFDNHHIHIRCLPDFKRKNVPETHSRFYHEVIASAAPPPGPSTHTSDTILKSFRTEQIPQLWRVCRQLYLETANLPFSPENAFSFEDASVLERFISSAKPEQIQNITKLWLPNKTHSVVALACEALKKNLRVVYIRSRVQSLKVQAESKARLFNMEWLRIGWELAAEREAVKDLVACWSPLVKLEVRES